MNRTYKSIYNESSGTFVAVSENAKGRGKRGSGARTIVAAALVAGGMMTGMAMAAVEIPNDGEDNKIEFTTDDGEIAFANGGSINFGDGGSINFGDSGTISGLSGLTVNGSINADQLVVGQDSTIVANGKNVATVGQLHTTQEAMGGIDDRVTDLGSKVDGIDSRVEVNEGAIDTLGEDVHALQTDVTDLQSNVEKNTEDIYEIFTELGVDPDQGVGAGIKYFRANSTLEDSKATGEDSIAIGPESEAKGESSFAAGKGAVAENTSSIAIGDGAKAELGAGDTDQENTIAIGSDSTASAAGGTAIGHEASASAADAVAFGSSAEASGDSGVALGREAQVTGSSGIALGQSASARAEDNISIGRAAGVGTSSATPGDRKQNIAIGAESGQNVEGYGNTAIGYQAGNSLSGTNPNNNVALGTYAGDSVEGEENISIGYEANSGLVGNRSVAIGKKSSAQTEGLALGLEASAGSGGVALGRNSSVAGAGVAVGSSAEAASGFVALGDGSVARQEDVTNSSYLTNRPADNISAVSVGSSSDGNKIRRRIVNVEDGAEETDAVNVRQLYAAVNQIDLSDPDFAGGVISNLQDQIDQNMQHYVAINDGGVDQANKDNSRALATDSIAIGPDAETAVGADHSLAVGHTVATSAASAIAIGHEVTGGGLNSTTIGNSETEAQGESGVAIGTNVKSAGLNSIVIGRDSSDDVQGNGAAVSDNSIVIGTDSDSTAEEGIVIGKDSLVNAARGIAQGSDAETTAEDAISQGTHSRASGTNSIAQGTHSAASASNAQASGTGALAQASDGIAIGTGATSGFTGNPAEEARNINSIAIGNSAKAEFENALAMGVKAEATDDDAMALGTDANASAARSMAQGQGAAASAEQAMAIGAGAIAEHDNSVALGSGSETIEKNEGAYTLSGAYTAAGSKDADTPVVSVGSKGNERQIVHVAPGVVSEESTDAINGSQLWATNTYLQNLAEDTAEQFGGDTEINDDGTLTDPNYKFKHENETYQNVGDAMQGLQDLGMNFEGDDGQEVHRELGQTLTVKGGAAGDLSEGNIGVIHDGDGGLLVQLAEDLTDLKTIEVDNRITIGDATNQTSINEGDVTTESLTVNGETNLGDNFWVTSEGDVHYAGDITEGTHIVNKDYLDGATQEVVEKGLTFVGDDEQDVKRELGQTLSITGGADLDGEGLVDGNIGVTKDGDGGLKVQLAQNIDLGEEGSVEMGDTHINNKGLTIVNGPSITIDGIDAGGNKITGVAPGEDGTDAVNVDQLEDLKGTIASGWTATDDDGNDAQIAPGGVVTFAGDDNIIVAQKGEDDDAEVVVSLNKDVDLGDDGSLTIGDTTVNNGGLIIHDGPSITLGGIDAGELRITNVAPGTIDANSWDAINGSQLQAMGDSLTNFFGDGMNFENGEFSWDDYFSGIFGPDADINNLADALEPWNIGANGGDYQPVLPGDSVDVTGEPGTGPGGGSGGSTESGDGNIVVDIDHDDEDHTITLDLADNVHVNESITVGDTDGPYLSMGDDGDEGSAGSLNFYGEADSDGERRSASQSVVDGPGGVGTDQDEHDTTRLGYTDQDGNEQTLATLDDGLTFGSNDGEHDAPLNTQVDVVGGSGNTDWSEFDEGQNIMTKVTQSDDGSGEITVALAQDVSVKSITAIDVDATNVTADRVEINNGPVINENGIDMSGKRITNMAPGVNRGDAVNMGQLQDTASNLQNQIDDVRGDLRRTDKRLRAGVAAAMATAGLPQAYLPGKSMMAVAGGAWNGESGVAIGYSTVTDNGKWIVKLSGNASSRGAYGGTVGVGYQW